MKEIIAGNSFFNQIVGSQIYHADCKYKVSAFIVSVQEGKDYLVYHTLYGNLFLLECEEYQALCEVRNTHSVFPLLVEKRFLVLDSEDELKTFQDFRQLTDIFLQSDAISQYTVMTTTDCNARCPYCYEYGIERFSMTEEVAADTADFIRAHRGQETVSLRWFGGEPLYNSQAIDTICRQLKEWNIPYKSKMISNGYLFDADTVKKSVDLWRLKNVQITLDGTERIYNKTKRYIYSAENPFATVINNIGELLKNGIHVQIRLNVSTDNIDDIFQLVDYISDEIKCHKNLLVYVAVLYDLRAELNADASDLQTFKERVMALYDKIFSLNLFQSWLSDSEQLYNHCMADNNRAIAVFPNGDFFNCEHYAKEEVCGNIYEGITNRSIAESWKQKVYFEKCGQCAILPRCNRLAKCPRNSAGLCGEFDCSMQYKELEYLIKNSYSLFKKNFNKE